MPWPSETPSAASSPTIYERAGVLEYWLCDVKRQAVRVYRRAGAGFLAPQDFSVRSVLATPLLPGLEIRVREVFE